MSSTLKKTMSSKRNVIPDLILMAKNTQPDCGKTLTKDLRS